VDFTRRRFISGLLAAPVVITTPGLLMPVRKLIEPHVVSLTFNFDYDNSVQSPEWIMSDESRTIIFRGSWYEPAN
jgi:hypothetical protein